jgi:hypothetical protein
MFELLHSHLGYQFAIFKFLLFADELDEIVSVESKVKVLEDIFIAVKEIWDLEAAQVCPGLLKLVDLELFEDSIHSHSQLPCMEYDHFRLSLSYKYVELGGVDFDCWTILLKNIIDSDRILQHAFNNFKKDTALAIIMCWPYQYVEQLSEIRLEGELRAMAMKKVFGKLDFKR